MIDPQPTPLPQPAAQSCATCAHWRVEPGGPRCPVTGAALTGTLSRLTCPAWQRETVETFAVELYDRLRREEQPR